VVEKPKEENEGANHHWNVEATLDVGGSDWGVLLTTLLLCIAMQLSLPNPHKATTVPELIVAVDLKMAVALDRHPGLTADTLVGRSSGNQTET